MKPPLVMSCTIARPASTQDSFGQPNSAPVVATSVPCYWWPGEGAWNVRVSLAGATVVDQEHVVFAPGQDVRTGDRIATVTDHLGNVVFAAADYRVVEHVAIQRNHIDCTVRFGRPIGGRS